MNKPHEKKMDTDIQADSDDKYYRTTFSHSFVVTRGVYMFFKDNEAFWFGDLVNSRIPKVYNEMVKFDDSFLL